MGATCSTILSSDGDEFVKTKGRRTYEKEYKENGVIGKKAAECESLMSHEVYCCKTILKDTLPRGPKEKKGKKTKQPEKELRRHIKHLVRHLDHPSIARLVESFEDDEKVQLIYEWNDSPILKYINYEPAKNKQIKKWIRQLASALRYSHNCDTYHGVLCGKNVHISEKMEDIKIMDCGLLDHLKPRPTSLSVLEYCAPELVDPEFGDAGTKKKIGRYKESPLTKEMDVWSVGILTYQFLTGKTPWDLGRVPKDDDKTLGVLKTKQQGGIDHIIDLKHVRQENDPEPDCQKQEYLPKSVAKEEVLFDEMVIDYLQTVVHRSAKERKSTTHILECEYIKFERDHHMKVDDNILRQLMTFNRETHVKKSVMKIATSYISEKNWGTIKGNFDSLDIDGDGCLDYKEIEEAVICKRIDVPEGVVKALQDMDSDENGVITIREFAAATLDAHRFLTRSLLWQIFRTFDIDNSGSVSATEMVDILLDLNQVTEDTKEIKRIKKEIEIEIGGRPVTFDDFLGQCLTEGQYDKIQADKLGMFKAILRARITSIDEAVCAKCRQKENPKDGIDKIQVKPRGSAKERRKSVKK